MRIGLGKFGLAFFLGAGKVGVRSIAGSRVVIIVIISTSMSDYGKRTVAAAAADNIRIAGLMQAVPTFGAQG